MISYIKKLLITFITILISFSIAGAQQQEIREESKADFAKVIRMYGYICGECTEGYVDGLKHKGIQFRIICDDYALMYNVTVTPKNTFIVEPQ
ncbi:hypothetical protein GO013_16345 [Pseudodesulfovibrio sp. JC047]|uniref:hypothetical protein n=1 Tax=Pseudodesulfovibrio sp. JC047 TaxID=2683199 RepID=UPI0013D463D2|nr:hypothetical protein [Pseudodesulfovibrio sp. JC047]NDV20983.1 hypothetical protein [Pseudodesulfovibrio sp. JC047]